jgi:hypothetical protein
MALQITEFGKGVQNEPLVLQALSDDVNCKAVRLSIGGGLPIIIPNNAVILEQNPEIGTSDAFRFEVASILRAYVKHTLPSLVTGGVFQIQHIYTLATFSELDENGAVLTNLLRPLSLNPLNLKREQNLIDFFVGDTGNPTKKLLSNAPNLQKIKRGDVFYVCTNRASYTIAPDNISDNLPKQQFVIQELDSDDNVTTTSTTNINPTNLILSAQATRKLNPFGLGIEMPTNPDVKGVLVFVRDIYTPFTVRSEIRRYNPIVECAPDSVKLVWINQYGVPEVTYFTANYSTRVTVDNRTSIAPEPVNATFLQGGLNRFKSEETREWTLLHAKTSPQQVKYLAEILRSNLTVLVHEGLNIKVVLTDTNLVDFDKFDSIDEVRFTFVEAKSTVFYD